MRKRESTLKEAQVGMHLGHAKVSRPRFAFRALKERFSKSAKRVREIKRLAKKDLRAKRLFKTGALPQATYGVEILGLNPQLARQLVQW